MSWKEADMYPYVRRNLRQRYPESEGWEIYEKDKWPGYEPDFVVERILKQKTQRTIAEVKATCQVSQSDIDQLNSYVRNLSGKNVEILGKILAVPSSSDTSIVPDDMSIMFLRSFKCEDGKIIWYNES